jgi:hypothetical protein
LTVKGINTNSIRIALQYFFVINLDPDGFGHLGILVKDLDGKTYISDVGMTGMVKTSKQK